MLKPIVGFVVITHQFVDPTSFPLTLRVTDTIGQQTSLTQTVRVP